MKHCSWLALSLALLPTWGLASEWGEALPQRLYDGTLEAARVDTTKACGDNDPEACFALGLTDFLAAAEGLSAALYRYGATTPTAPAAAMLLGLGMAEVTAAANPNPEPLTYDALRTELDAFITRLDTARTAFEKAGAAGDYVIDVDPARVRIDLNGDGERSPDETLLALLGPVTTWVITPAPDATPEQSKRDSKAQAPAELLVGLDRADAFWFAGYTQVTAAPVDLLLAHDFSGFYDAFLHRVFKHAGLPMEDYSAGGTLFMDADSDAMIADLVAAIHTADFPVIDAPRLRGVLDRLTAITSLSRRNWDAIMVETDDRHELVPSPTQTSQIPGRPVTLETVTAWRATLDTMDAIFAGELLVPHWRFAQGFDLKRYFETADETDLVLLVAGQGALPFLRDGKIADAQSFAEANRAFGTDWLSYAFWFN